MVHDMPPRSKHRLKTAATAMVVLADAKRRSTAGRARAEALVALVQRRKLRITEDFFDIGESLRELLRRKLYLPLGYASFDALVAARRLFGTTHARKLVAIVDSFSREQALGLGMEKAFAVISYAAATPAHEVPQLVITTGIDGKPVESLSVRDIVAKARRVRRRRGAARALTPVEKEARIAAVRWQALLRKGGLHSAVANVRHTEGDVLIEVHVPVEELQRLLAHAR